MHAPTFYHGGAPGLQVGTIIVPRNKHPQWRTANVLYHGNPAEVYGDFGTTVSFTSDKRIASAYAGEYVHHTGVRTHGQVYEVTPLTEPQHDPDFPNAFPEIARCENGAEIVAVHERVEVEMNPRIMARALGKHLIYMDGSGRRLYNRLGFVRYTAEMRDLGYTRTGLIKMGRWVPKNLLLSGEDIEDMDLPPKLKLF